MSVLGDILQERFSNFKSYLRATYSQLSDYDAEDVIQQTALNLLTRGDCDICNVTAYIYAALRNGALSYLRKRGREMPGESVDTEAAGSADEGALSIDLKRQVKAALSALDEKSRFVFVQTELAGKSYKELSEQTGEPVGTLLSRKSRAAKKLKSLLSDYYNL